MKLVHLNFFSREVTCPAAELDRWAVGCLEGVGKC